MDLDAEGGDAAADFDAGVALSTFVVPASPDEEAEHAKVLAGIAKDAKGTAVWAA
jgi:hypothetical protein